MGKRLQITLDQLHAAWARRRRADWPADFTGAMAHPLLAGLVRAEALRAAQRSQRTASTPRQAHQPHQPHQPHQAPPARTAPNSGHHTATPQRGLFDHKRAAAGDRDDD